MAARKKVAPDRITLSSHSHVVLDDSDNAYASRDIKPGELIEMAPALIVPPKGRVSAFRTEAPFSKAAYLWNDESDEIALAMGRLSMYGYSNNPNAVVEPDHAMRVFRARATRFIEAGERLTRFQQFKGQLDESEELPPLSIGSVSTCSIEVRRSQWGLGIFATEDIKVDEIVESCHIIQIGPGDRHRAGRLGLHCYVYGWQQNGDGIPDTQALSLGYGGIYNHSSVSNNASSVYDMDNARINFVAIQEIAKGSEILHNYGWGDGDKRLR